MKRQLITILAAALFALPAAGATWMSYGTYEPDTFFDDATLMYFDPDTTVSGQKLYFNVYQTEFLTGQNANVGTLGSRIQVAGVQLAMAILGPWKDCNGDGYVGIHETALLVYPSAALLDTSICPVGSTQNDGDWVYEYMPVGYAHTESPAARASAHPKQIEDIDARVWGDFGLPGDQAAATCAITPLPHGTTAGTGWAIRYLDCFASKRVTGAINDADAATGLGIGFSDPNNPQQSGSPLNQQLPESLFGNPETGETGALQLDSDEDGGDREYAFTATDCSAPKTLEVRDPTGLAPGTIVVDDPTFDGENGAISGNYGKEDVNLTDSDGRYAWVAGISVGEVDPSGSWADGLNHTFMGFRVGGGDENYDDTVGGDCDYEADDDDGDNTYSGLHQTVFFNADGQNQGGSQVTNKVENDFYFEYFNGDEQDGAIIDVLGPNVPGSIVSTTTMSFLFDPTWSSNVAFVTTPQSINRATLAPSGASYGTFYARVGSATTSQGYTTPGGEGRYGSEACGSNFSGAANGWVCDPANWYTTPSGTPILDGTEVWQGFVGMTYQFRDIDCNDGTLVRGVGVQASLVAVSDAGACLDALV